ncbi:lytic transglycosylase domain-containing protein [Devosia rhodophyticola]|uniref:Lytic transglycosylase domain-containing protein n=1 Tax=Devosia rhodophyticola TaxID=3026423 RepID=A0ABY7YUY4_9HYPH|nr:lytic transglycosylase domain-containing protein [Devosia rhodophyticola]WDR04918.1 lytic transglycosylase domain-containing protein [Devosia rhodophyticola]
MRHLSIWLIVPSFFLALLSAPLIAAEPIGAPGSFCSNVNGDKLCIGQANYTADVCALIAALADHWQLPNAFLARLIWQESRFDPSAVSPAGAEGIAQFMPGTARIRRLHNTFDPAESLAISAQYLAELNQKFGNLGLAAAAYNAGENRITRAVTAVGHVPAETRQYVFIITGQSVDYWFDKQPAPVNFALHPTERFNQSCIEMAKAAPLIELSPDSARWQPWGVLLAQNFSRKLASDRFTRTKRAHAKVLGNEPMLLISVRNPSFGRRTRYSAMVGKQTRAEAQELCARLMSSGGNCIVQKNGR